MSIWTPDSLRRLRLSWVRNVLDWRFVRLGELQTLTRASYLMLPVVPILAGVWTALPLGEPRSHYLPHSWVLAFLAALAVTLGQVIYQMRAPEVVRRSTLSEFVRQSRNDYADQPSRDRLEAADIDLDYKSHPELWFEDFMYYYEPIFEIVKV
jgi:hypothetical protein